VNPNAGAAAELAGDEAGDEAVAIAAPQLLPQTPRARPAYNYRQRKRLREQRARERGDATGSQESAPASARGAGAWTGSTSITDDDGDPGATRQPARRRAAVRRPPAFPFGNMSGYYGYRVGTGGGTGGTGAPLDPRLAALPEGLFRDARVGDVGCHEGRVLMQVATRLGAASCVGWDIDEMLVRRAGRACADAGSAASVARVSFHRANFAAPSSEEEEEEGPGPGVGGGGGV